MLTNAFFYDRIKQKERIMEKEVKKLNNDQLQDYVVKLVESGVEPRYYKKYARVEAVQGEEGEEVVTVMADGHVETSNKVVKDEDGNCGWIVTNPSGEKYIVPHKTFAKRYDLEVGADGKHAPKGAPIKAIQISEDIEFTASWGEIMVIKAGGYLNISNKDDIYGIQEKEFYETYAVCDKNGIFYDANLRKAFGQEENSEK